MDQDEQFPEEQDRLYRERERLRGQDPTCATGAINLQPDIAPVIAVGKCDEPTEPQVAVFIPPNPPPLEPVDPDLLPPPILLYSREASAQCPAEQADLTQLPGNPPVPVIIAAGAEVQEVYLDGILDPGTGQPVIPQSELFRIAVYGAEMQAYVTSNLIPAIISGAFVTFEAGFATLTGLSGPLVTAIREALVTAQVLADDIAQAAAESSLLCGWYNRELWVVCDPDPNGPGYEIKYEEPPPPPPDWERQPAGEYSSTISQADADALAAIYAAIRLNCLVPNDEQTATCSSEDILDETTPIEWPSAWLFPTINGTTKNPDPHPLELQNIDSWEFAEWQTADTALSTVPLDTLNGQEFLQVTQVGIGLRRTLRTTVVVLEATPAAAARTKDEANAIAYNLAVSQLDCFFPNRPRVISCMTADYGNPEVNLRADAMGRDDDVAGRLAMYVEMRGGDPDDFGGPAYTRFNSGVKNFAAPNERADERLAFEVRLWPGFFAADSAAVVAEQAYQYSAGYLQCDWISPMHTCTCITEFTYDVSPAGGLLHQQGEPEDVADWSGIYRIDPADPSQLSVLDPETGEPLNAKLDRSRSVDENELPRGLIFSNTYPNAALGYGGDYEWPDLPQICQSSLQCLFVSCKMACCEPRPDERPKIVNEAPNFASTNAAWAAGRQSTQADHASFMARWWAALSLQEIEACSLSAIIKFLPKQYDDCTLYDGDAATVILPITTVADGAKRIVHPGPNNGDGPGMPARFKFGGLLKWGQTWAEPSTIGTGETPGDPGGYTPGGTDPASLDNVGTVKGCHNQDPNGLGSLAYPDPWGFYHCAEGVAEGYTPFGLEDQARSLAVGRLDCTHIAWPRHLVLCPQHNQRPWGPVWNLNVMIEGATTGDADMTSEMMLLPLLECRDMHNYMLTYFNNQLTLPGPSMAVVGKDECLPLGLSQAVLYETCGAETEADTEDITQSGSGHVIVYSGCCPDELVKKLFLAIVEEPISYNEIRDAKQKGQLGLPSGVAAAETFRQTGDDANEVYYIGSFLVTDVGGGQYERITVQAHSGPVILSDTCCDSSSSSGSGSSSSSSSSGSSGDSSSGGSSGGSGSGSGGSGGSGGGSDKSTAIVPASWQKHGFTALFTVESPEVVFRDTIRDIPIKSRRTRLRLDRRFIEVCEPHTLRVASVSGDKVVNIGAEIDGDYVVLTLPRFYFQNLRSPLVVQIDIVGIRKGFLATRFPARDLEQFEANEVTINSAYPGKDLS